MIERRISLGSVLSVLAALCSLGALGAAWIFDLVYLGMLGVTLSVASATLQIRTWFCGLAVREREAYNLGRESVRHMGAVR